MLPPEAATSQHTLFLDCSSFVSAVYLQAFGYELPSDLTWHMIDMVRPRVFYYELTHKETKEELDALEAKIRGCLQPGDVITHNRETGSGHTMLYLGNDSFTDCTTHGPDSYDFKNRRNRFYDNGGMWINPLSLLFERETEEDKKPKSLFSHNKRRFSISRPLDMVGEPTADALARITTARGLVCAVETSHPGARNAAPGDTVEYCVYIRNQNEQSREVSVEFTAPYGTALIGEKTALFAVLPKETGCARFAVQVEKTSAPFIDAPKIVVNALHVYAPRVLLGKAVSKEQNAMLIERFRQNLSGGKDVFSSIAESYSEQGVFMENSEKRFVLARFHMYGSTAGDVLYRKAQQPEKDLAVYGMFGGTGVITPEVIAAPGIRTTQIDRRDLLPGDVILCGDDPYGSKVYACFFTGTSLIGDFEAEGPVREAKDSELDRFLDSLPGRFFYLLLRPWLFEKENRMVYNA